MTIRRKLLPAALALGLLGLLAMSQVAGATHVRPKGATPTRASLVPAYRQCTAANRTHGAPLAFPSCNPPVQASDFLTLGTPDANGAGANSTGFLLVSVRVASPEDLLLKANITDVRCRAGTSASVCGSANSADGADYSGELQGSTTLRISDHYNGPSLNEAATVTDLPLAVNVSCASTTSTTIGGTCSVDTSANAVQPGAIPDGGVSRAVVELAQIKVADGGQDGQAATADNTPFAIEGVFVP
jgi:hypothetical protein